MTVQQAVPSTADSPIQVCHCVQSLPPELGSLQRLKAINATSNRLQTVSPAILQDCSSLQTLLLHANPISAEVRLSACSAHSMLAGIGLHLMPACTTIHVLRCQKNVHLLGTWDDCVPKSSCRARHVVAPQQKDANQTKQLSF